MQQKIKGMTETCIYRNEQSGFAIYRIVLLNSGDKTLVIKGPLSNVELESFYEFNGDYHDDPRYGLQFQVDYYEKLLPQHREFVVRYLSGPAFPGIGAKTAEKIVDLYGEAILELIREDEDFSLEVPGLKKDKAQSIVEVIRKENPKDNNLSFLLAHGMTSKQIQKLTAVYGDQAIDILTKNPYAPVYDVDGIGFKIADKLAASIGFDPDHPYRIEALVLDRYKQLVFKAGDSYIDYDSFTALGDDLWKEGINMLVKRGELVLDETRLYHYTQYESECEVASFLKGFDYQGHDFEIERFDEKLADVETKLRIHFDRQQKEAVAGFLKESVMILTGGPGTGKSTLLSGIVTLLQQECPWLRISLCAPTGRAAKRLEALTNVQATTIHSLLKWNLETNTFGMNEENPLDTDVMIIDEFSMMDIWLLANVIKASQNVKKFLFVGDQDQLPSVSSGFVLGDLMASNHFMTIILKHNYRQEKGSEVIDLALNMNQGRFDVTSYHEQVRFFEARGTHIKDIALRLVEHALTKGYDLNDVQVLSPMYGGVAGIDTLNHFLQKMCNPASPYKKEIIHGSRVFREGDKVLQLKNQPDDFVFNGDIGMIAEIDHQEVLVDFSGNFVSYEYQELINLSHAYCISVHKAQGSEYPVVILIGVMAFGKMLSRRLYYTGVTRSSKHLTLIGETSAFEMAVKQSDEVKRNTYLTQRLIDTISWKKH